MTQEEASKIIDLYIKTGQIDKELFNKLLPRPKLKRQQACYYDDIVIKEQLETLKNEEIKLKN
jgi:hypothetical protein